MKAASLAAVMAAISLSAFAQTTPPQPVPDTPSTKPTPSRPSMPATTDTEKRMDAGSTRDWDRQHRATKIIGTDVRNRQGEKIGEIKEIVLGMDGRVSYAVVSTGGFLGIGDRLHAIPWSSFQYDKNDYVLDIDKARLSKAPGFDSKQWPNMSDDRWNRENRNYFPDAPAASPRK